MRYEFDLRGISKLPTYTFIQDISDENLSAILELNIPGLMVESSTVREYHTKYAAHILGYMGGMDDDDWEKYQKEGYSMTPTTASPALRKLLRNTSTASTASAWTWFPRTAPSSSSSGA